MSAAAMHEAQPSQTAMRVALRRAAHQLIDEPPLVFADPFAVPIVGAERQDELRRTPSARRRPHSAAMRAWVVARARFCEDRLAAAAAAGDPVQYLVLGAGLDTFALRNPYAHVRVFEVDHPATQAWKRERLAAADLSPAQATQLVPVNFEQDSLEQSLLSAGFDTKLRTVTTWLGVVPYLSANGFSATCAVLGSLAGGSEAIFDYTQPRFVLPGVEQLMFDSLQARVTQAGEPFQLFFTPATLLSALEPHGLRVADDLGGQELNGRYFAGRTDGLALLGSGSRLCHAVVR